MIRGWRVAVVASALLSLTAPEPLQSPVLAELGRRVASGDTSAVARFWASINERHTPLVEAIPGDNDHVRATFLWKGDASVKDVVLMAQPDGIAAFRDPRSHLLHLDGTDVWYRTHTLPRDAEFSYMFSVNPPSGNTGGSLMATFHKDPYNPLPYRILTGPLRSIARMPGVSLNSWLAAPTAASRSLVERTIASSTLNGARQVWMYQTPGAMRDPQLVVLLDGQTYTQSVPTPRILDNLYSAGDIGPTVAVFVKDGPGDAWKTDMYFSDAFVDFVATELIPWAEREYHFTAAAARTTIGGDSIAGLSAAFAAFRKPAVFGHVIAQSASFWLNNRDRDGGEPEWLSRQVLAAPTSNVSFAIDVGQMEFVANEADRIFPPFVPGSTSLLAANRHLRDILRVKGYRVRYAETYGDHEPLRWQRTLPDALIFSLGRPQVDPR
jgi:enterochelin esterase-like enzyme